MKYILVNYGYVLPIEDEDVDELVNLIYLNQRDAHVIICDTIEETTRYAPYPS